MLAEAWRPSTIKTGDLDSELPGYAKGAQEASEIFGIYIRELEAAIDILLEFADGIAIDSLPDRFVNDRQPTTPGGMARAHTYYLISTRNYAMRFHMTAEETRSIDVHECKLRMVDAAVRFRDMRDEALELSEKYFEVLQRAGYGTEDVYGDGVVSSLPAAVRVSRFDLTAEADATSGGVDEG